MYLAFVAAVLAGLPLEHSVKVTVEAHRVVLSLPFTPELDRPVIGVLCGATLITILGIIDDIWGISPMEKLFGQLVAAIVPLP
ncbi:MAG: hypothetical protein E6H04_11305, partial [Bacillati bacterium ANGP1]